MGPARRAGGSIQAARVIAKCFSPYVAQSVGLTTAYWTNALGLQRKIYATAPSSGCSTSAGFEIARALNPLPQQRGSPLIELAHGLPAVSARTPDRRGRRVTGSSVTLTPSRKYCSRVVALDGAGSSFAKLQPRM